MLTKQYLNAAMLIKGVKRTLRRIPLLKNIMAMIRKKEESDKSPDYDLKIYQSRAALLDKYGIEIKDRTLIDIGCGNNCLHAFEFLSSGAKEVILCELFAATCLTERKIRKRIEDSGKDYDDTFSKHLKVIDDSIEDLKSLADNSVDVILSTSLLEHVYDPEKAFKEMKRIIKKDGFMFHSIDLRDHFFFDYPLHFLRYSPWWWKNVYTKPETFTNRHRMPYFLELTEKYGFKIIHTCTESTEQETARFGLHKNFESYSEEENRVTHLEIIARAIR